MLKKVVSLCLVFCMIVSFMVTGYAQSSNEKISSDTVVTRDNIYGILDYLGIDSSKFELSTNSKSKVACSNVSPNNVATNTVTVGELKKIIEKVKNESSELISERFYTVDTLSASGIIVNKTLYHESKYSTYTVTQSCTGTFDLGVPGWISCSGGSASADSDAVGFVAKISGTPEKMDVYLSGDKTKVCMDYKYKVQTFLGIANVGTLPINNYTHTGSCNWLASEWAKS